jgi:hypothetical protein
MDEDMPVCGGWEGTLAILKSKDAWVCRQQRAPSVLAACAGRFACP